MDEWETFTMKCGRSTYNIRPGDVVMHNGACAQLITRYVDKNGYPYKRHPSISKKEFKRFLKLPNLRVVVKDWLTYYHVM